MDQASKVKQFTEESTGISCPTQPIPLSKDDVSFIIRMVNSEMVELAQTVCSTDEEAIKFVTDRVNVDVTAYERTDNPDQLAADQADAAADAMYYMYNLYDKHGINLSRVFDVVHAANLRKRWPDGKYHRRDSDGKVMKPPGFLGPDILAEIVRQKTDGSWS